MVAVRSAHLNPDQQFELETWIASLTQEGKTAAKLTAVYRDCEQLLAGNPQGPLLLWRGRNDRNLITLSMDRQRWWRLCYFRSPPVVCWIMSRLKRDMPRSG